MSQERINKKHIKRSVLINLHNFVTHIKMSLHSMPNLQAMHSASEWKSYMYIYCHKNNSTKLMCSTEMYYPLMCQLCMLKFVADNGHHTRVM